MKFLFLILTVTVAAHARPSHVSPFLKFSNDGHSFSYSFQTPAVVHSQHLVQPVVRSQYVQEVVPSSRSVIIGPAVSYHGLGLGVVPLAKYAEPANIQLSSDGFVLDTPEVAQARAAHLAQVAQESARAASSSAGSEDDGSQDEDTVEVGAPEPVIKSTQPIIPANIQVSSDGFVLDTPEVAQAKAEHEATYNALAKAAAAAPDDSAEQHNVARFGFAQPINVVAPAFQTYHVSQPVAPIVKHYEVADIKVSADGHVLDTPEVAQAKAMHFAKYNEAAAIAAANPDTEDYNNNENKVYVSPIAVAQPVHVYSAAPIVKSVPVQISQYSGLGVNAFGGAIYTSQRIDDPPANIQVSADGFVQDTPEVASAKAAHLAKLAEVGSTSDESQSYGSGAAIAYSVPIVQPKWTGPEADIQVGPDGYVIDTPEVQQARAEHLATRSQILANTGSEWSGVSSRYAAVSQQPIQDTAEVSAARAAHLQAYAQELARHSASKTHTYGQLIYSAPLVRSHAVAYSAPLRYLHFRYAPIAHVALTPDGQYLQDTPEVAAAKAEHFAAHARALHQ